MSETREIAFPMQWHPPELETGTRLVKLKLHSMEYLEALDDDLFSRLVQDWIEQNPPYRGAYWLGDWNSYALSIRTVVWMQQYATRCERLADPVRAEIHASLIAQIRFLIRNLEMDIGGNHLIKNIKALLWAGCFFTGREAERWARLGERLLLKQLAEQILDDGLHHELSPAYHGQVFADLLECFAVLPPGDGRSALAAALDRMAQVLADLTHPDGRVSLFNDGGLTMTYAPRDCLEVYRTLTGRRVMTRELFALWNAGYYGVRSRESLLIVDCGPVGPDYLLAHAHGDILSFEWSLHGRRMIVDAGVYEYNAGSWREYARSTRAHNTVTVGDEDQCEFWQAFRVGRRARPTLHAFSQRDGGFALDGSHDGYRWLPGEPRHRRRFTATAEQIRVEDSVVGGEGQTVTARLLCHPECRVTHSDGEIRIVRDKAEALLRTEGPVKIESAWWCPDFGVRIPAPQIVIEYGKAPCSGGFFLEA